MDKYLLALDAGTGSIRAVLFDSKGNQIDVAQKEWSHPEDSRWAGSMNFDWNKDWELTKQCINQVISESKINPQNISAVSSTCMREGFVLYDENNKEIWACANTDSRATSQVTKLIKSNPDLEKELYKKSGQSFALNAIPRLLWIKENQPEIYNNAKKISMINDWLCFKLSGKIAVEPSNASTTGLLNLKTRKWDLEIAKATGIKTDIFPEVLESGSILGQVTEKSFKETSIPIGVPVVVGGGDCQNGSIGVGSIKSGDALALGGTFWQYEVNTDNPIMDKECRVRINCHSVENLWQYEALAFNPGLTTKWFRDAFCDKEKEEAKELGINVYDILNDRSKNIPAGSYGTMCIFSDIMNFTNWKHASPTITNFSLDSRTYDKYTIYHAILENAALLVSGHIKLIKDITGYEPEKLIFAGGASYSDLWCQILSDVTGKQIQVPVVKEASALGTAILAGYGVGIFSSIEDGVNKCVKLEKIFEPDMDNHQVYIKLFDRWRKVYKAILDLSKDNTLNYMWKAPGLD